MVGPLASDWVSWLGRMLTLCFDFRKCCKSARLEALSWGCEFFSTVRRVRTLGALSSGLGQVAMTGMMAGLSG